MRREIHIVGNWKMNLTMHEISNFFIEMTKMKMELKCKAWIAPQALHIPILKEIAFTVIPTVEALNEEGVKMKHCIYLK